MKKYTDPSHSSLSAERYFSLRNRPSCTDGTVKGVSEKKIVLQRQEAGGVLSLAQKQIGWRGWLGCAG